MKVCLIGYGKMGRAIEQLLLERSHEISGHVDHQNEDQLPEILKSSDVAIEFTRPDAAVNHLKLCFDWNVPVICGTTGWHAHWKEVQDYLNLKNATMIYASNFSVGVQLFFALNKMLADLMQNHKDYNCSIKEIHHTQKKDAPSGTAISLADDIIKFHPDYDQWTLNENKSPGDLTIIAERIDEVVGTHLITYESEIDRIEIKHEAFNRKGFALGAVLAAEWIIGKKGLFTMNDVLGIKAL
jgi:4-hydroxy-tetrahydrodipicolinate reductase